MPDLDAPDVMLGYITGSSSVLGIFAGRDDIDSTLYGNTLVQGVFQAEADFTSYILCSPTLVKGEILDKDQIVGQIFGQTSIFTAWDIQGSVSVVSAIQGQTIVLGVFDSFADMYMRVYTGETLGKTEVIGVFVPEICVGFVSIGFANVWGQLDRLVYQDYIGSIMGQTTLYGEILG